MREYTGAEVSKILNVTKYNVLSTAYTVGIIPTIRMHINNGVRSRTAFFTEEEVKYIKNYYDIREKYPNYNIKLMLENEKKLLAEGFLSVMFCCKEKSGIDPRFLKTEFFPSYEEITPFQFQEIE